MEIFSNEFKGKVKNMVKNVSDVATKTTNAASKTISETVEKVKNSEVAQEVMEKVDEIKVRAKFDKAEVEKKIYDKVMKRKKEADERKKEKDLMKAEIEMIRDRPDVSEIYSQRSRSDETTSYGANECIVTAKVTVIGVVRALANGKYGLQISFSRRNPEDTYDKRLGYVTALRRAIDPHAKFEIEGHEFETIKVGDFDTPLLKNIFMPIADTLIDRYEYDVFRYKKALANSILAEEARANQ